MQSQPNLNFQELKPSNETFSYFAVHNNGFRNICKEHGEIILDLRIYLSACTCFSNFF